MEGQPQSVSGVFIRERIQVCTHRVEKIACEGGDRDRIKWLQAKGASEAEAGKDGPYWCITDGSLLTP